MDNMPTQQEEKKNKRRLLTKEVFETLAIIIVIFLLFQYVLMSVKVNGSSMEPTYIDGERGIMLRKNPLNKADHHDVVVVNYFDEENGEELIVKRVFATPGETIEIKDNTVYVNDKKADDHNRNPDTLMDDMPKVTLKDDEYFVLGDNRNISLDSRIIGPVKEKDIQAINGVSYWPIDKIGLIN